MMASKYDQEDLVRALIDAGARLSLKNAVLRDKLQMLSAN